MSKVLIFSSIGLNALRGLQSSMQIGPTTFPFFVLLAGLAVQSIWMLLTRKGRDGYVRSITNFQKPSSLSERFYDWHLSRPRNAVIEAAVVDVAIVLLVLDVSFTLANMQSFMAALPVLLFVLALSVISPIQTASRVGGLVRIERKLYDDISLSTDKVSQVRAIIENLLSPVQVPDGRYWFALFRIALKEDTVGWSVRDVLIEKAKELDLLAERVRRGERVPMKSRDSQPGAEIE